ncbi:MAG: hypothetical protein J2P38_03700 [Candidatus Dormibacteraeota bacterium]|nr:hypothetical protein [Candidatus Dormibacteraeota bacterium]
MRVPLRWWEERSTRTQVWISATVLCVFFFVLNWIPFQQPLFRAVPYGVIEGLPFAAIAVWATHAEHQSRLRREREARAATEHVPVESIPVEEATPGPDPEMDAWLEREHERSNPGR